MESRHDPQELLAFWQEAGPRGWFRKDPEFDRRFHDRFLAAHEAAAAGQLDHWLASAPGALALVLLLDQFPRNAFRGTPRVYATDPAAREAAGRALEAGFDRQVEPELRQFFYLPFMHSEQLADLDRCVALTQSVGGEPLRYALHHREIVRRFGRFPHRNAVLGRPSTEDEQRFLASGGFAG
jgi:uncharacterized protein (DUF924 family)